MRILIALGGNALLKRGEPITAQQQHHNVQVACKQIGAVYEHNELVITHGNGPQVGLLALQGAAYDQVPMFPLDVLGAESVGMIGYMIQQELSNVLPKGTSIATLLTQVEVDLNDEAFSKPTKPIGPVYSQEEAKALAENKGWSIAQDGKNFRRVVASPKPKRIIDLMPIHALVEQNVVVICAGGGGIPTRVDDEGRLQGVEAVIDKDLCSALLANHISADLFVIATDVPCVYLNWGQSNQQGIASANPHALSDLGFAAGSMGPKVQAAINFVTQTGRDAVIGSLVDIEAIVQGKAGTRITTFIDGIEFYETR